MQQLYDLTDEFERVMIECTDRETGEITDEADTRLEALQMGIDERALLIARNALGERREAAMVKETIAALQARVKVHESRAAWCEKRLSILPPETKLRDAWVQFSFRKSQAVEIIEPRMLPADCWKEQAPKIDVERIRKRLKEGFKVTGAKLATRHNVQIR